MFEEEEKELSNQVDEANKIDYNNLDLSQVKQGSKEWFHLRLGLFTGSKLPDLMTKGKGSEWGLTAMKVIRQVYVERDLSETGAELYVEELFNSSFRQTKWGQKYESFARDEYCALTGKIVDETHFSIHKKLPYIGGSFDGEIIGEKGIIEIKCPYDITVHASNCELDESDMDKHTYYPQIQGNIEVANAEFCDFISFDIRRKRDKIKIIRVERNQEFIDTMLRRIWIANKAVTYLTYGLSIEDSLILATKDYDTVSEEGSK